MKSTITLLIIITLPFSIFGQFSESIRTGRPGQGINPFTVGNKVFQVQTGMTFNRIDDGSTSLSSFLENTVLRLGITENIEINGAITWQSTRFNFNGPQTNSNGISDTQIGGRINLYESSGVIPSVGLQGRLLLKAQSADFRRDQLGSMFTLSSVSQLTGRLAITSNLGVAWMGNGGDPNLIYVLNASYAITDKIGVFAEIYGLFNDFDINTDTGMSLVINSELQLDFSTGWQGDADATDWFIDMGVSWRWKWRNNNH